MMMFSGAREVYSFLPVAARPVIVGPVTFLLLSKVVGSDAPLLERLDEVVPLYADLLGRLYNAGAEWVQIDEPALVGDRSPEAIAAAKQVYDQLSAVRPGRRSCWRPISAVSVTPSRRSRPPTSRGSRSIWSPDPTPSVRFPS